MTHRAPRVADDTCETEAAAAEGGAGHWAAITSAEAKFVGNAELEGFVLDWLRHICLPDPVHPEAVVHTLYYDTSALDAFREKANGDFVKTKCRLRWYEPDLSSDPSARMAYLEVKQRVGAGRRKSRTRMLLPRQWLDAAGPDDPGFGEILAGHAGGLGERLPTGLAPVGVVRYRRRRFICPVTLSRVCLDSAIGMERINTRLLPRLGHAELGALVIEIKDGGRAEVPWMARLFAAGVRKRSFSKYGACIAGLFREG